MTTESYSTPAIDPEPEGAVADGGLPLITPLDTVVAEAVTETEGEAVAPEPPPDLFWTVAGRTAAKPSNDRFGTDAQMVWRKSEDRFAISETEGVLRAVVSDGAGSSGMFCGAWAETLVNQLPQTPITDFDGLNGWMDGFWGDFSAQYKKIASSDSGRLSKFVREGSYATLAACWLDKHDNGMTLRWAAYGDSPIFVFARNENDEATLVDCFPSTLKALELDPYLLNWKDLPDAARLQVGAMELSGPTSVILASDGIGQYLVLRYLADQHARLGGEARPAPTQGLLEEFRHLIRGSNSRLADAARAHVDNGGDGFGREMAALRRGLESDEAFNEMIRALHGDGLMPNDDATLIAIDIEVCSPQPETISENSDPVEGQETQ